MNRTMLVIPSQAGITNEKETMAESEALSHFSLSVGFVCFSSCSIHKLTHVITQKLGERNFAHN